MPVFSTSSARPRQELAMAIVQGEGSVTGLIGEQILPPFPVNRRTAHIIKATLADTLALRVIDDDMFVHAPGALFNRVVAKFGDDTITVTLRGQEIVIPNEVQLDYEGYLGVEQFFVGRFGQTAALTKEKLIAAQVFNTANTFGNNATNSTVPYTLANLSTISFISDVIAATRAVKAQGERPDTVVMSGPVYERIRQAATVQAYVAGTLRPGQEADMNTILGALREYGIKQVLVGDGYYNAAADGATPSLTQLWNNTYIWVGKAGIASGASQTDGLGVPTLGGFGVNVFWEGYQTGGVPTSDVTVENAFPGGNYCESYPAQDRNSNIVRVLMSQKPYVANTNASFLIATQYV